MIRFLVNRPIAVLMSFLLISLLGVLVFQKIPLSLFPDITIPKMEVVITNPGYLAEDFENQIVSKFRSNLIQIQGVNDINSKANTQNAKIELIFDYGTNIELSFFEVNEKIDLVMGNLQNTIERPKVIKTSLTDIPSLYIAVGSKKKSYTDLSELSSFVIEKLKPRFEQQKEISFVDISGLAKERYIINLKENQLIALGLEFNDVKKVLVDNNYDLGSIDIAKGHFEYSLAINNSLNSIHKIENLPIETKQGTFIPFAAIAQIKKEVFYENQYHESGKRKLSLALIKHASYSGTDFKTKVTNILDEVADKYPHISFKITKDQTNLLEKTMDGLSLSLLLGILFAIMTTLFFLKTPLNALLIATSILCSLMGNMLLFYLFDVSLNLISISGLILGVGLMIDNVIIVLDNIAQKLGEKKNTAEASIAGVMEIITPLISSALTTSSIFVPLIFLSGLAGVLFYDQAITVTLSLLSSFFVSIVLLPTLYVLLNKKKKEPIFNQKLAPIYHKLFSRIDHHKKISFAVLSIFTLFGVLAFLNLQKEQTPTLKTNEIEFKVFWGSNIKKQLIEEKSKAFANAISDKITNIEFYINEPSFYSKTQRKQISEYETLFIGNLKNGINPNEVAQFLTGLEQDNEYEIKRLTPENALNAILINDEYNLKIISYDKDITQTALVKHLKTANEDLIIKKTSKQKQIVLQPKSELLKAYKIDLQHLIEAIKIKIGKEDIFKISNGNTDIPLGYYNQGLALNTLLNSRYISKEKNSYLIKDLVDISVEELDSEIEADIGGRADIIYIKTKNPENIISSTKNRFLGKSISFEGSFGMIQKLSKEILLIFIVTIVLLYLILAIQFESLKLPIIILIELPIGISFALLCLYLTGQTLNAMSFIGLIVMTGIVINDSILKIDLIRKLHKNGTSVEKAIHIAGERRINAIIMTTLTTIFAVIPILFQNDISSQLQTPLVIALGSGLLLGTLISIFFIPLFYKILMK